MAALTTTQLAGISTANLQALTTSQVVALTTAQVAGLTTSVLSSLTTTQVQAIETRDVAALTTTQLAGVWTANVQALTTTQIAALTTTQLAGISTTNLQALTTSQVVALTTAQVAGLTTSVLSSLTTTQVQAIETRDVAALTTTQLAGISTANLQALTTSQVVALTTAQVAGLTTSVLSSLTTTQVQAIETRDVAALTTTQLAGISTANLQALTTSQVVALTTAQVAGLTSTSLQALTTEQFVALTTSQMAGFTSTTIMFNTAQVAVLTSAQSAAMGTHILDYISPIALDLNGDGIKTIGVTAGVSFDLLGSGSKVQTGWVAGGDGFLVMDRNHDGAINDGAELFGQGTTLANGQKAANGYLALSEIDSNADGVINASDAKFADLMVWVDSDSNAVSQSGELHSLGSLGITQLDLNAATSTEVNNGNLIGLVSNFTTTDGAVHEMADVWFATDKSASEVVAPALDSFVSKSTALVAPVAVAAEPDGLRSVVGGLVDAMAAFDSSRALGGEASTTDSSVLAMAAAPSAAPGLSSSVLGIVDALRQFDANGQSTLPGTQGHAVAAITQLKDVNRNKPDTDLLASSK
ncbi:MAG: hypothetical protein IPH35_12550 [Rhodoferax sp.]|nr:hypothetical protein [Rhodoferax sp.]